MSLPISECRQLRRAERELRRSDPVLTGMMRTFERITACEMLPWREQLSLGPPRLWRPVVIAIGAALSWVAGLACACARTLGRLAAQTQSRLAVAATPGQVSGPAGPRPGASAHGARFNHRAGQDRRPDAS